MNQAHHYVSGFFATTGEAQKARSMLLEQGLPAAQMEVFETAAPASASAHGGDSNAVLKDVLVDGTIGTAIGTGIGALAEVALVAANVSLFIASPLLAPLVMMGWGASIGAVIGASVGATSSDKPAVQAKPGWLSALVTDAIASGQVVLIVATRSVQQTLTARNVIQASVGDYKDTVTALQPPDVQSLLVAGASHG